MPNIKEENPTRKKILLLLKKSGGMSTDELSKVLKITPMGIRQHLLALERKGLVEYETKRHGIGRPGYIYKITEKADSLFPKHYDTFILQIFSEIEKKEGRKKIEEIFRWRKDSLLEDRKTRINGSKSVKKRLQRLADLLEDEGYIVEFVENKDSYQLRQYNCPISSVSKMYRESCKMELELYRDLIGDNLKRIACISDGSPACVYSISKQ